MEQSGVQKNPIYEEVELAKKGDQKAFIRLYSLYYKEMYAYACYMLRQPQDAEDAVSDTVIAAFEGIRNLRNPELFRQWIFKILSNQCKKRRKEYALRNQQMEREGFTLDTEGRMNQVSDGRDLEGELTSKAWVQDAFEALTEEEKYIVNSFLLGGYKGEEIAESLGLVPSTVRSKYRRALMKMKKRMEGDGGCE